LAKKANDEFIHVEGARENNLQDISISLPKNKMVVITGLSGSGKSSLAFDTIYAEGQRRYMETFSSYARQFLGKMERPDVDKIEGLSPVISIEQKTTGWNPRSTVGTTTEIYDFLRLLYARIGEAYSYITGKPMIKYSEVQILEKILEDYDGKKIVILAPVVRSRKGHYRELFDQTRKRGYSKVRIDGELQDLRPGLSLDRYKVHDIEIVIDRIKVETEKRERLSHSLQIAMKTGQSFILILDVDTGEIRPFSKYLMDAESGISYEEPSPNSFSFNSPYGTCPKCKGLGKINVVDMDKVIPDDSKSINDQGIVPFGEVRENTTFKQLRKLAKAYKFSLATPVKDIPKEALEIILHGGGKSLSNSHKYVTSDYVYDLADQGIVNMVKHWYEDTTSEKIRQWAQEFMVISTCDECEGYRLKKESLHYKLGNKHIGELAMMDLDTLGKWMEEIEDHLNKKQKIVAAEILKEIRMRVGFLLDVGLHYLQLDRPTRTLSGGESQRTRLATQIGTQLTGVTYILDEPSIGLHQRDNQKLITALRDLSTIGNTVIVVEHDKDIMLAADYLVDLGPGAGKFGGDIIAEGVPKTFLKGKGTTSAYLQNKERIEVPAKRRKGNGKKIVLKGATGNNLKNVNLTIPLGKFICVTGVSGSGKSSLINETLYPILRAHFYKSLKQPLPYKSVEGLDEVDKVIEIDQSPIGRTPRSNPATYTGVFTDIRSLFANVPEAMIRGYKPGRFSFNVKGGRCETCNGGGKKVIEMNFLPDVYVECDTCLGKRYNRETLEIIFKGKNINDVLEMPVDEAVEFFKNIPNIFRKLNTLKEVGLGYITLGQRATTLSGGEAQRVKLSEELSKRSTGNTLYILDEPSTGLHFQDIKHLNGVLNQLVDKGNSVIVIEHNLDIIKIADHIIDIGPEAGRDGGTIVFQGTPEKLVAKDVGHTARFLKIELDLAKA
jgi:excinuclease ABC subunit A